MLKQSGNAKLIDQPRVEIAGSPAKPFQAVYSKTESVKVAGTNADVGTIFDVTASIPSNSKSVVLKVTAELRELVDASPLHDGSQNEIRTTKATTSATLTFVPSQTI
jgi:hypothetical protein